jgi:hypothetical protein
VNNNILLFFFCLISEQRNIKKSVKAPLSMQEVHKKDTKTEKERTKENRICKTQKQEET